MKESKFIARSESGYLSEIKYEHNDPRCPYPIFTNNKKNAVRFCFKDTCKVILKKLNLNLSDFEIIEI